MNIYHSANECPDILPANSIVNADCFDVFDKVADASIDMILCDLPYGTTACKWDTVLPFDKLWAQYKRVLKPLGVVVLTASQPFTSVAVMSNLKWFKYDWTWDKVGAANFANIKNRPLKTKEDILIFSPTANFVFNPKRVMRTESSLKRDPIGKERREHKVSNPDKSVEYYAAGAIKPKNFHNYAPDGKKHPIDIIKFSRQEKDCYNLKHPTKKPLGLFKYLIETYTNAGMRVLDNCAGSGTTGAACIELGREFILIEKESGYFNDTIIPRLTPRKESRYRKRI